MIDPAVPAGSSPYDTPVWALLLGFGSAVSLVVGSWIGLAARPRALVTAACMAFGAGALLFALTIEIVAHSIHRAGFLSVAVGMVVGGVVFEILNQALNSRGGFLRKASTLLRHVARLKRRRGETILDRLGACGLLRALPPDEIAHLVPHVAESRLSAGAEVFAEGDVGDALYIVEEGAVSVRRGGAEIARLGPGEVFGEMALVSGEPRNATVAAARDGTRLLRIPRADFDRLLDVSPETREAVLSLGAARSGAGAPASAEMAASEWRRRSAERLRDAGLAPTAIEVRAAAAHAMAGGGAVLGIWLGILLDAIPESIVIGISLIGAPHAPWAFVAGVFLANFPEAMSSSVVMRSHGFAPRRILGLWSVIVAVTALGAYLGNTAIRGLAPGAFGVIEGLAAGAMLTSVAETMLPEAYEQGGWIVGLSTLGGFLAALTVKAFA